MVGLGRKVGTMYTPGVLKQGMKNPTARNEPLSLRKNDILTYVESPPEVSRKHKNIELSRSYESGCGSSVRKAARSSKFIDPTFPIIRVKALVRSCMLYTGL